MKSALTEEQRKSLLDHAQERSTKEPLKANKCSEVSLAELVAEEKIVRGRLPGLELIAERFSRATRQTLSRELGVNCEVLLRELTFEKWGNAGKGIIAPSSLHLFRMPPLAGQSLLVISPRLAQGMVDCLFGGTGRMPKKETSREPSSIELRLMAKLVGALLEDWKDAWAPIKVIDCVYASSESNPLSVSIGAATDGVAKLVFDVGLSGDSATLSILVPSRTLDSVVSLLSTGAPQSMRSDSVETTLRLMKSLKKVEAQVRVILAQGTIKGRDVLSLKPGDVLQLETKANDDALVLIEGRPKFKAKVGVSRGSKSAKIFTLILDEN